MKVLFDTNVVLDVLLDRQPFRDSAASLLSKVERKELIGVLGATTLTTIYYLVAKASGKAVARSAVRDLIGLFQIAVVNQEVLSKAVESALKDFEDAVLAEAGILESVDAIVTRDPEDFQDNPLPVLSPRELQAALGEIGSPI